MKDSIQKLGLVMLIGLGIIIGYISGKYDTIEKAKTEQVCKQVN